MEYDRAIEILKTEQECVRRASRGECARDCENCDLLLPDDEILTAYKVAIRVISLQEWRDKLDEDRRKEEEEYNRRIRAALSDLGFEGEELPSMAEIYRALGEKIGVDKK